MIRWSYLNLETQSSPPCPPAPPQEEIQACEKEGSPLGGVGISKVRRAVPLAETWTLEEVVLGRAK